MFAIARIEKIKSLKQASVASAHNARLDPRFSKEVEQSRSYLNEILVGSELPYADIRDALPEHRRKNAVLAVEVLLTASPEYFAEAGMTVQHGRYDEEKMQAWKSAALNFAKKQWGDNLVNCALHLDEATPHLQMFVVPKREDGKLDARSLFDRQALIEMQDKYQESVAHLGLKRGISASVSHREHESLGDYYKRSKEPVQDPELTKRYGYEPLEPLEPGLFGKVDADEANKRIAEGQRRIKQHEKAHLAVSKEALEIARTAKAKDDELEKAKRDYERVGREAERSQKALDEAKKKNQELTAQLREIPLAAVLERLGAVQNTKDKSKWTVDGIEISPTGQKFKSFTHDEIKGGGAITLVRQVRGYDFNESLKWLSENFGQGAATADYVQVAKKQAEHLITQTKAPSEIPKPEPKNWGHVKKWLLEVRKLPERAVDILHDAGRLFADKFRNAVFVNKTNTGAEIVGTGEQRFKGFRGSKDSPMTFSYSYSGQDIDVGSKIALVESQIDAISAVALGFDGAISTSGGLNQKTLELAKSMQDEGFQMYAAFDNDEAGKEFTKQAKAFGISKSIKPINKDWNDDLKSGVHDIATQLNPSTVQPRQQSGWER